MSDHKYTCPDCGRLYVCDEGDQDPPCCNREVLRAEIERLEAECMNLATHGRVYKRQYEQACQDHATAMAEITLLRALLRRYRTETPLGHQPHMISHEVDAALAVPETASRNDRSKTDGQSDTPTRDQLLAALRWIDKFDPETTAAAEDKFGFNLFLE